MAIALGVMGCGLIGGSLAKALRRAQVVSRVVGFDTRSSALQEALALGVIDQTADTAAALARGVDVLVLAVPVAATASCLVQVAQALPPQTLVMDVGSTKVQVMADAQQALGPRIAQFVPAHPIAGKELSGVAHAQADLFCGRRVLLTPSPGQDPQWVQRASALWQAAGAQVSTLSAHEHDEAMAAVSHLPHLLAFAYMRALTEQDPSAPHLTLAGSGFRDFSRIAAADAHVWRDILMSNRDALLQQLKCYGLALSHLEQLIRSEQAEALQTELEAAAAVRRLWGQSQQVPGG